MRQERVLPLTIGEDWLLLNFSRVDSPGWRKLHPVDQTNLIIRISIFYNPNLVDASTKLFLKLVEFGLKLLSFCRMVIESSKVWEKSVTVVFREKISKFILWEIGAYLACPCSAPQA